MSMKLRFLIFLLILCVVLASCSSEPEEKTLYKFSVYSKDGSEFICSYLSYDSKLEYASRSYYSFDSLEGRVKIHCSFLIIIEPYIGELS